MIFDSIVIYALLKKVSLKENEKNEKENEISMISF